MARGQKNGKPETARKAADDGKAPISARLDGRTLARLKAWAAREGARTGIDIGPSMAAAALIKQGLDAAEAGA